MIFHRDDIPADLREFFVRAEIGLEPTLPEYLDAMVFVCRELRRVLKPQGTFWLNIGDSYAGSWGAQSREHAGKHAPNVSAISANQVKAAGIRTSGTGSIGRSPGLKPKDLMLVPARLALALQDDGWWVRSEIIWAKPNPMPESVTDRPTNSHEKVWLLTKSERYFYDHIAVRQPLAESSYARLAQDIDGQEGSARANGGAKTNGNMKAVRFGGNKGQGEHGSAARRASGNAWEGQETANLRNVWTIATQPFKDAHFATFPPELAERCIKAGCPVGGHVLDPFGGAGTTGLVADRLQRHATLIELNPDYAAMAQRRVDGDAPLFAEVEVA